MPSNSKLSGRTTALWGYRVITKLNITIRKSEKMPGVKRTVQARFRRPSWSEYMYVVDAFLNIGSGADVYGKVHSNTGIRMDGIAHNAVSSRNPRFQDSTYGNRWSFGAHTTVSPADPDAPVYPWPDGTVPDRPDIFMGGRQFPVPRIEFNGVSADLTNMKQEAQAGNGKYFDSTGGGRRIILKTDGNFDVCTVDRY